MAQRLVSFEGILRKHSGMDPKEAGPEMSEILAQRPLPEPATPVRETGAAVGSGTRPVEEEPAVPSSSALGALVRASSLPPATPEKMMAVGGEKRSAPEGSGGSIAPLIKRLKDKAQLPQTYLMEQLENFQDVDKEFWNRHFPENYRQRMCAEGLAEVYSQGKTGEQYGRDFLRERSLLECHAAREIIAGLSAIDTQLMVDRTPGLLNRVATEKLCRKIFGLIRAFENCRVQSDWSRPKGKESGSWKSKVDWDSARRIDPFLRIQDTTIRVPAVEEEIRKGMTQEADVLRARKNLADAGGGSWEPQSI
jgi:hypothetical protein